MAAVIIVIMIGVVAALTSTAHQSAPDTPDTLPPDEAAKIILKKR